MKRILITLSLVVLLGGVAMVLLAQPHLPQAEVAKTPGDPKPDDLVAKLLAMSPEERRAYLKRLSPEERRGLWLRVKKALWDQRGAAPRGTYDEDDGYPIDPGLPGEKASPDKVVGTIAYDSGFPSVAFGFNQFAGNRFNTHTAVPVLASGTVSTVQGVVVPGPGFSITSSNAGFVLFGPLTGGGGAPTLFSSFATAVGPIDTMSFTGLGVTYTGSSFFVLFGDFTSSYIPVAGTGTTLGQGYHGVIGLTGPGPPLIGTVPLANHNTFVRAAGNIVPVELMTFDVE